MSKYGVSDTYMGHMGGSKFYQVITICNDDRNRVLVIYRWGKVGTMGQLDCEVMTPKAGFASASKKIADKSRRRYGSNISPLGRAKIAQANDVSDIDDFILSGGALTSDQWSRIIAAYMSKFYEVVELAERDTKAPGISPIDEIVESVAADVEGSGHEEWGTW